MRLMHLSAAALSAAALLLAAAPTSASAHTHDPETHPAVTTFDGGFETPDVPAPSPFTGYAGGQQAGPWTAGGDSVDPVSDRLWDAAGPVIDDVRIRSFLLVLCPPAS
ncbi:hypothetical protein ABZ371_18790 [Streptomyces sp. NPDC005899]|uniref:hypothetical protein n=1 Tax=Streptomyces sp. NPDC005899 TaxID=3155716 RepID=UPI003410A134